jgi:nicotinate-nucleotide adenylyltransferase
MAPPDREMRVAVFGGSFNPPHVAHVLAVAYVLACSDVDRVLVVPCFRHPFAKSLAPFDDRLQMCRLAFEALSNVEVSDIERSLGGESLTVRTLERLHADHPEWSMRLVVGSDVIGEMDRWTAPDRVRALAPPLVLARAGHARPENVDAPSVLPEVSSTAVRAAFARGATVDPLVPRRVLAYAEARGLYR